MRVHDSQAYGKMDVTRERISCISGAICIRARSQLLQPTPVIPTQFLRCRLPTHSLLQSCHSLSQPQGHRRIYDCLYSTHQIPLPTSKRCVSCLLLFVIRQSLQLPFRSSSLPRSGCVALSRLLFSVSIARWSARWALKQQVEGSNLANPDTFFLTP